MPRWVKVVLAALVFLAVVVLAVVLPGDWISDRKFTQIELETAKRAVESYSRAHGSFPVTLQVALDSIGKPRLVDKWGGPSRLRRRRL